MKQITDEDIEKAAMEYVTNGEAYKIQKFTTESDRDFESGAKWVRDQQPRTMAWVHVRSEKDCPGKDYRDDPRKHILRVMHDDGRGGNHIETAEAVEIWDIARQNDGAVYWLNENSTVDNQPKFIESAIETAKELAALKAQNEKLKEMLHKSLVLLGVYRPEYMDAENENEYDNVVNKGTKLLS